MTVRERQFIIVLIINVLIVLGYLVVMILMKRESKRSFLVKAAVMFLCPVAGPLCVLFSYLLYLLLSWVNVDLEDVIFSKERVKTYSFPDEEKEKNLVPLEDAIAVSDKGSLRRLMMDVVKDDQGESLTAISRGLYAEDTETSHYAASVLQEKLGLYRRNVQTAFMKLQETEDVQERAVSAVELLDYMTPMLKRGVFGTVEQRGHIQTMDTVAEILLEADKNRMTGNYYEELCHLALDVDEDAIAEKWCNRLVEQYPEMLIAYTCRLHMYFKQGLNEQFRETLDELKKANVVIDAKTLELIRIFE